MATDDLGSDIARLVTGVVELDPKNGMTDAIRLLANELSSEAAQRVVHALEQLRSDKREVCGWVVLTTLREFADPEFSEETVNGLMEWLFTARGLGRRNRHTGEVVFPGDSPEDCLMEQESLLTLKMLLRNNGGTTFFPRDPAQMDLLRKWLASF